MPDNTNPTRRRRAMTTENARRVRAAGHAAEKEFAELIDGKTDARTRKKDVVDKNNDVHSVKSGEKKWQIFLYSKSRFETDLHFQGRKFFIQCINSFPKSREKYLANKTRFKNTLKIAMTKLKEFLSKNDNKKIFLETSFLNNAEVDYLTIKSAQDRNFNVFDGTEAVKIINHATNVENSMALMSNQWDKQKVVFKLMDSGKTIGEIEMRNDSKVHYRQVKFWMDAKKTLDLLIRNTRPKKQKLDRVFAYGKAINKFRL